MTQAYPLEWPAHIRRTPLSARQYSRFDVSADRARRELRREAEMAGDYVVISTNIELRRDGEPYASRRQPEDTAVAVYFRRKGAEVCLACDQYIGVWENMRAIGKTLEAMRGIERWGTSDLMDQAFSGFTALPPPDDYIPMPVHAVRQWHEVLSVNQDCPLPVAEAAWKALARITPEEQRREINTAIEAARAIKQRPPLRGDLA